MGSQNLARVSRFLRNARFADKLYDTSYGLTSYGLTYSSENDFIIRALFGFGGYYTLINNNTQATIRDRDPVGNRTPSEVVFVVQ